MFSARVLNRENNNNNSREISLAYQISERLTDQDLHHHHLHDVEMGQTEDSQ